MIFRMDPVIASFPSNYGEHKHDPNQDAISFAPLPFPLPRLPASVLLMQQNFRKEPNGMKLVHF